LWKRFRRVELPSSVKGRGAVKACFVLNAAMHSRRPQRVI
jgi:hypothetical protein